jgi:hypothetical protein
MKRVIFFAAVLVILAFGSTVIGCVTSGGFYNVDLGLYNKYYAEEQTCILEIPGVLKVDVFNKSRVAWGNRFLYGDEIFRSIQGKSFIRIPAGRHELTASYSYNSTGGSSIVRYNVEDLKITYNFLAGRTYRLDAVLSTDRGEMINDPTNYLTGSANRAFSARLTVTEISSTIPKMDEALKLITDRRLDGTWQFDKDPKFKLVFFGDTWRLLSDGNIVKDDGGTTLAGVFFLFQNELDLVVLKDQGIPIKYNLSRNTLTFNSVQFLAWMAGKWNKIDSGIESSESNPLVGTWKTVADDGNVTIFQFDKTGTARKYEYDTPGYLDYHSGFDYQYDNSTNVGTLGADGIILDFGNNNDELIIENIIYKRE